jgi:hypothetical protein
MSTITVSKEKLFSAILGVICALFIIIGSAEKSAVYFVIAILCLIAAIGIHFVNKQCLTNVFRSKEEKPSNPTVNTSDPINNKQTFSEPPIIKLQEVQVSI